MSTIFSKYVRPELPRITLQMFVKFVGTIMELLLPWMLSVILDDIVPKNDRRLIYIWGVLMLLCALLCWLCNVYANAGSTKSSAAITRRVRHDLFSRISYLSAARSDEFTSPSLVSRLTSDTYNVHQMVDRMQRLGVRAPIMLLGGMAITFTLEPVLTLVLAATLPLLTFVVVFISKKGVGLYTKTQTALDGLVRKVQENMTGVRVIKALSKSDYEKERFDEVSLNVVRNEQKAGLLMSVTNPAINLLLNLGLSLVVLFGAYRVNAGVTQPGKIIAFLSYFTMITNALMAVSRMFVMYSKGAASARRIEEVLLAPEDMGVLAGDRRETEEFLTFENVSFSYNKVQNDLHGISFSLKKGETLGIIGPTGSGKSTILKLLLRFYDPDQGEIRLKGEKLSSIPPEILHTRFGVAFQNDFLFADTIRENIDFGRGLSDEAVVRAARTAQADFIAEKEGGMKSRLAIRGSNLSGGQRQRLLIARALAADPDILILDDSSSALDYKTDAALRKALRREFQDTTKVIVAQRVSSILGADKILVLEEGREAGYGTHEELLKSCPGYKEIYDVQMGEANGHGKA